MKKIILGVVYPCIGIGNWIGSYQRAHEKFIIGPRGWYTHVLGLVIGLGHIRADLKKITIGGDIPMYWDWELDWTISESI